ncbi:DUF4179 domain-containing protein [Solibacillus sp. FSL K6-1523]|uniref:DUF4179 domain-containing protein n=1 Tax=Solibacillus sp. FSL K6-1523 TaxID=2921471 RepID=UPI0030FAFFE6
MKDLLKKFNDEKIDLDQLDVQPLTDLEKKVIKKRLKKKLMRRRSMPVKVIASVASLALVSIIAVNSNFALADIPIIGAKLEAFVYSQQDSLTDYKTILGESVEDNGVKVTLNEVILDDGQLLISSTFHTKLNGDDLNYNWFSDIDVYIDGRKIEMGGGGGPEEITESYIHYFWSADVGQLDLQKEKSIRIVFNDLRRSDRDEIIKGKWHFKFKASAEKLFANTKTVPINQQFTLENGQTIDVQSLVLTPISSKIVYEMPNVSDYVYFKIENEHGEEIQATSAQYGDGGSYNRFVAIDGGKIKIIPVLEMRDLNNRYLPEQILEHEVIELDLSK